MTCYTPISAYRGRSVNPKTGKRPVVFNLTEGFKDLPIKLPCGRCIGCRLERSRQWAIRCMHEASLHKHSVFVTLTYSDEELEKTENSQLRELRHEDFQRFMKRLRKRFGSGIRYYMCGEYGEKFGRPHYHAAIFGLTFKDKKLFKNTRGNKLYTSQILTEIWGHGHASFGSVTFNSAAYIARYIIKKNSEKMPPSITSASINMGKSYRSNPSINKHPAGQALPSRGTKNFRLTSIRKIISTSTAGACDLRNTMTYNLKLLRQKKCARLKRIEKSIQKKSRRKTHLSD